MAAEPTVERHWNVPILILGARVAIAGFGFSVYLGRSTTTGSTAVTAELVAARDLDQRTTLAAGDVKIVQISADALPPGSLTKPSQAVGLVLQVPIKQGQPLLANLVANTAAAVGTQGGFLPLPSGLVAATLPTAELVGVAGYIRAGDYIDVIAVVPSRSGGTANVRTIYPGLHVIRVGAAAEQSATSAGTSAGATTASITVGVTECQAEFLSWFLANASLKYTLLSSADYQAAGTAPADTSCPASGSKGVTESDIRGRWPNLVP
jgi:pilus assembly protein CpaB